MKTRVALYVGLFAMVLGAPVVQGQDQSSLTFEVASVKLSGPNSVRNFGGGPGTRDPGQIVATKASMLDLLVQAYDVQGFQIEGPGWFRSDTETFDLHAKAPEGATKEQARIMMQNLLAERFKLALHHITKDFPAYEMVIAKSGVKFKEFDPASPTKPPGDGEGYPPLPEGRATSAQRFVAGHARLAAHQQSISGLAAALRPYAGQPIIDKTGLTGKYDFYLHYDPFPSSTAEPALDAPPNLNVALEQQLGLKLESKKLPFDVLVIDHVEKVPSAN